MQHAGPVHRHRRRRLHRPEPGGRPQRPGTRGHPHRGPSGLGPEVEEPAGTLLHRPRGPGRIPELHRRLLHRRAGDGLPPGSLQFHHGTGRRLPAGQQLPLLPGNLPVVPFQRRALHLRFQRGHLWGRISGLLGRGEPDFPLPALEHVWLLQAVVRPLGQQGRAVRPDRGSQVLQRLRPLRRSQGRDEIHGAQGLRPDSLHRKGAALQVTSGRLRRRGAVARLHLREGRRGRNPLF